MRNRLYLVRHGENVANLAKELSCRHVDYSLTPKGVLQAQQTAAYFKAKSIHEIYASPLKRAVETAEIIAAAITTNIVIVGHGGIFTATLKDLCPGIDGAWLRRSQSHNCSIIEIMMVWRAGIWDDELIRWASYTYLRGAAAQVFPSVPEVEVLLEQESVEYKPGTGSNAPVSCWPILQSLGAASTQALVIQRRKHDE